jgi:hypothetical protein
VFSGSSNTEMHVGSRDGSGADPSGSIWLLWPFTPKAGENGTRRAAKLRTSRDGNSRWRLCRRCGDTEEWDRRNRASSPESEEGALPLIDTDNTDRERIKKRPPPGAAVPHESGRNSNLQGRRVRSFLEVQIGRRWEQGAHGGLRRFESALRRKIGQLSVLKFELPYGPKRHF